MKTGTDFVFPEVVATHSVTSARRRGATIVFLTVMCRSCSCICRCDEEVGKERFQNGVGGSKEGGVFIYSVPPPVPRQARVIFNLANQAWKFGSDDSSDLPAVSPYAMNAQSHLAREWGEANVYA